MTSTRLALAVNSGVRCWTAAGEALGNEIEEKKKVFVSQERE